MCLSVLLIRRCERRQAASDPADYGKILNFYFRKTIGRTVRIYNRVSECQNISVPQGSVPGPLFFLLSVNDLWKYMYVFNLLLFAEHAPLVASAQTSSELLEAS